MRSFDLFRSVHCLGFIAIVGLVGCANGQDARDCRACTDPDSPECAGCLGLSTTPQALNTPGGTDQIALTESSLDFAVIGDTRPASVDDTAAYPTAVITTIFQDLQAENPRPSFAIGTGDYQFSSNGSTQTSPQLDLYLQARSQFSNPEFPAMGNHECTGATVSNCGPGTTNGTTSIYTTFLTKVLSPLGIHNPYYSVVVKPSDNSWSAKFVFIAANAWTTTQATWLDATLAQPTTYTFVVRHESSQANTAPGVTPSGQIIAKHPYTMLIVGHSHTYKRMSQKEVIIGNGGAPLTTGSAYGYGIVSRRSDGSILFTIYQYKTHAVIDTFAVNADGSPASGGGGGGGGGSGAGSGSGSGSGSGTGSACAHDLCSSGGSLSSSCDPCVTQICSTDSYCCTTGWSSVCVAEVASICGETTCSGGSGGGGTCAHAECATGGKLASGCDSCVTQICGKDSYCCSNTWDSTCVAEVGTICGETCH